MSLCSVLAAAVALPLAYHYTYSVSTKLRTEFRGCKDTARELFENVNELKVIAAYNRTTRQVGT